MGWIPCLSLLRWRALKTSRNAPTTSSRPVSVPASRAVCRRVRDGAQPRPDHAGSRAPDRCRGGEHRGSPRARLPTRRADEGGERRPRADPRPRRRPLLHGRRNTTHDQNSRIDLTDICLIGADLRNANLSSADHNEKTNITDAKTNGDTKARGGNDQPQLHDQDRLPRQLLGHFDHRPPATTCWAGRDGSWCATSSRCTRCRPTSGSPPAFPPPNS